MCKKKIGITALVPPELIYACGGEPFDVNNVIPGSKNTRGTNYAPGLPSGRRCFQKER